MGTVFLIRHCQSQPSNELANEDWPLSAKGYDQAQAIAKKLSREQLAAIYSSPYKRAVATVEPLASKLSIKIYHVADLRERKLSAGFIQEFDAVVKRAWTDFDWCLPECETSREAQTRMVQAIQGLQDRHADEAIAVASNGNAIGLYLNALDPTFGFEQWRQMNMPHIYRIDPAENGRTYRTY